MLEVEAIPREQKIPFGFELSIKHFLHVPDEAEETNTKEGVGQIIRVSKNQNDSYTSENIEKINTITSPYFSTTRLDHFCLISCWAEYPCKHTFKMYLSLRRNQNNECPHANTVVYCYSEMEKKEFMKAMKKERKEEAAHPILLNLCRNFDYTVFLYTDLGRGGWDTVKLKGVLSHDDVQKFGLVEIGKIPSFPHFKCATRTRTVLRLFPKKKNQFKLGK